MKGKPRPKSKPKAGPAEVARAAGCSKQLASRLLRRGMTEEQIIARVAEDRRRKAEQELPTVPVNGHAANAGLSYAQAQCAKENALAELRQVELAERRRELMPVEHFRAWGMRFLIEGRDVLMNGPGQLRDQLAAECDPVRIEQILRFWVERAFERFLQVESIWNGEALKDATLRERFDAAKLAGL